MAVRLDRRTFVVVVPAASMRHPADLVDRIAEGLALASEGYPGVALEARVATTTTRARPLPIVDLCAALEHLDTAAGPIDAGTTPSGGRIVVALAGTPHDAGGPEDPGGFDGSTDRGSDTLPLPRRTAQQTLERLASATSEVDLFDAR